MIARAFDAGALAAAHRWAAAGGVALVPDPVAAVEGDTAACWVNLADYGPVTARVLCWDRQILRRFGRAVGVKRAPFADAGTAGQHLRLCGRPVGWAVRVCSSGAVERSFGWDEGGPEYAVGRLWSKVTGRRPLSVARADLGDDWSGPVAHWHAAQPGQIWLAAHWFGPTAPPEIRVPDERCLLPTETLRRAALEFDSVRMATLRTTDHRSVVGIAVRTMSEAYRVVGAAIRAGAGADESGLWVARNPVAPLMGRPGFGSDPSGAEFGPVEYIARHRFAFNRSPTPAEMIAAGYEPGAFAGLGVRK